LLDLAVIKCHHLSPALLWHVPHLPPCRRVTQIADPALMDCGHQPYTGEVVLLSKTAKINKLKIIERVV
jgi:hypothetical protein